MNTQLMDLIYIVMSYLLVLIIGFALLQFLSNGFLSKFLRVKASRGRKVLVEVHAITDTYYVVGQFEENQLKFKARGKIKKQITATKGAVFRKMGVMVVMVDDENNSFLMPDFTAAPGHDAAKVDSLINRKIMEPSIVDNKQMIMVVLLVLILLGSLIALYYGFQNNVAIKALARISGNI